MSTLPKPYALDHRDAEGYEPLAIEGAQVGEFRQIGTAAENALDAGIWRSVATTEDYFFAVDETFIVLEGTVEIDLPETGETISMSAGDIGYFDAGTRSVWRFGEPFKKFVVQAKA
ncbi:MAG TPA: cupin domain-containing protein [Gaiellaceae bacterium]|nr:cupin domain-containing protein [Gaiellaceae bacterium]